jgi:hypothetical protein
MRTPVVRVRSSWPGEWLVVWVLVVVPLFYFEVLPGGWPVAVVSVLAPVWLPYVIWALVWVLAFIGLTFRSES